MTPGGSEAESGGTNAFFPMVRSILNTTSSPAEAAFSGDGTMESITAMMPNERKQSLDLPSPIYSSRRHALAVVESVLSGVCSEY